MFLRFNSLLKGPSFRTQNPTTFLLSGSFVTKNSNVESRLLPHGPPNPPILGYFPVRPRVSFDRSHPPGRSSWSPTSSLRLSLSEQLSFLPTTSVRCLLNPSDILNKGCGGTRRGSEVEEKGHRRKVYVGLTEKIVSSRTTAHTPGTSVRRTQASDETRKDTTHWDPSNELGRSAGKGVEVHA